MSKTLPLTDPSAAELLALAQVGTGSLSAKLRAEVVAGLGTVTPPGDLEAQARAAAAAAGYTRCLYYLWDWATTQQLFIETVNDPQGPLGQHGIIVIAFKPLPVIASNGSVSVTEYPGGLGTTRSTSISTKPCDYTQPSPWTRTDYNQGIQFTVLPYAPSPRAMCGLTVGTQYFLNITNIGTTDQPEVRVSASRPQLA